MAEAAGRLSAELEARNDWNDRGPAFLACPAIKKRGKASGAGWLPPSPPRDSALVRAYRDTGLRRVPAGRESRPVIGDEARVVDAFCAWLSSQGWIVEREIDYVDVVATRDGIRLYAEAKGRTSSPGLDVDTLYGQLLRRMPSRPSDDHRYAVVVPAEAARAASRVPVWVRQRLAITVYAIDAGGAVREIRD